MKGITVVQAFQFWLKIVAIAVPAHRAARAGSHQYASARPPGRRDLPGRDNRVDHRADQLHGPPPGDVTGVRTARRSHRQRAGRASARASPGRQWQPAALPGGRRRAERGRPRRAATAPSWSMPFARAGDGAAASARRDLWSDPGDLPRDGRPPAHPGALLHQPRRPRRAADDRDRPVVRERFYLFPVDLRGARPARGAWALPDRQHRLGGARPAADRGRRARRCGARRARRRRRLRRVPLDLVRPARSAWRARCPHDLLDGSRPDLSMVRGRGRRARDRWPGCASLGSPSTCWSAGPSRSPRRRSARCSSSGSGGGGSPGSGASAGLLVGGVCIGDGDLGHHARRRAVGLAGRPARTAGDLECADELPRHDRRVAAHTRVAARRREGQDARPAPARAAARQRVAELADPRLRRSHGDTG